LVLVDSLMTALIAVFGTLAGVVVSNTAQNRRAQRAEEVALRERLRQERITAYAEFARSVMEFRSSQYRRWRKREAEPDDEPYETVRYESHQRRAQAWYALYRVRLVAGEARDLVELGTTAMDLATRIDEAEDVEELRSIGGRTRGAVEEFIDRASVQVT
jgi:type II secretory pathway pseudopilin PulG